MKARRIFDSTIFSWPVSPFRRPSHESATDFSSLLLPSTSRSIYSIRGSIPGETYHLSLTMLRFTLFLIKYLLLLIFYIQNLINIALIRDTLSLLRRNFEDSLPKAEKKVFVLKLSFHGTGQIDRSENGCRGRARKEGRKKDRKREGREAYVFDRRENRRRWWALTAH